VVLPAARPVTLIPVTFPFTEKLVWNTPGSEVPTFWIVALIVLEVGELVELTDRTIRSGARPITVTSAEELKPPAEAVTLVLPAARAVNSPFASMLPTASLLFDQLTEVFVITLPFWSRRTAVNCWVSVSLRRTVDGETVTDVTTIVSTL